MTAGSSRPNLVEGPIQEDWIERGACVGSDVEVFFPRKEGVGRSSDRVRQAKAICATCAVRAECLAYALENQEQHGIWGGTTREERRAIRRRGVA